MFVKLTATVCAGSSIEETVYDAVRLARQEKCALEFNFNGVTVAIEEDSDAQLIIRDWKRAMAGYIDKQVGPHPKPVLSKQEKDNDACIKAERDREYEREREVRVAEEEDRRKRVNARLEGAPDIQIAEGQEENWQQVTEKNGKSGIYHYAVRWARLMQVEIAAGKTVEEIQESTSRDADFEGMSGASFGYARAALKTCWKHGDELS